MTEKKFLEELRYIGYDLSKNLDQGMNQNKIEYLVTMTDSIGRCLVDLIQLFHHLIENNLSKE